METIAIIDDRKDMRETIENLIRLDIEEMNLNWKVISEAPLSTVNDYQGWIKDNEICVLILDENLSEQFPIEGDAVNYTGHAVAAKLRIQNPDLPQFIITSVTGSHDLDASAADLEDIIKRDEFNKKSKQYVQRMVRAGKSFVARYETDLAQLTYIAEAIVQNKATDIDLLKIAAIRGKLQLADDSEDITSMLNWLEKAETAANALNITIKNLEIEGGK